MTTTVAFPNCRSMATPSRRPLVVPDKATSRTFSSISAGVSFSSANPNASTKETERASGLSVEAISLASADPRLYFSAMPARRASKDSPKKLAARMKRRWRVVLLRNRGEILGTVEAPDVAGAKEAAERRSKVGAGTRCAVGRVSAQRH
jgi:hypothetical protein